MRTVLVIWQNFRQTVGYLGIQMGELLRKQAAQGVSYINDSWMWLWRKCGEIFYGGNKVCISSTYHSSRSSIKLGRQRNSLPGKRKDTLGAQEVEQEEI